MAETENQTEPKLDAEVSLSPGTQRLYRVMAATAMGLVFLIPLVSAFYWFDIWQLEGLGRERDFILSEETSAGRRAFAFVLALLPQLILIYGLWRLARLFGSFADGVLFSGDTLGDLRAFARCILGFVVADFLMEAPLSVFMSWTNLPGERELSLSFGSSDFQLLLVGALVFGLSHMVAEGLRLARENAEFV